MIPGPDLDDLLDGMKNSVILGSLPEESCPCTQWTSQLLQNVSASLRSIRSARSGMNYMLNLRPRSVPFRFSGMSVTVSACHDSLAADHHHDDAHSEVH